MFGNPPAQSYANNTAKEANNLALTSGSQGDQLYKSSMPAFSKALEYYQRLASGSPDAVNTAVAPETGQINNQYAAASQAVARNMPRGGSAADALTQLELQRTGQVANARATAVSSAPKALGTLGQSGIGLSQYALANALQAFGVSGKIETDLLPTEEQEQQNEQSDITKAVMMAAMAM